MIIITGATSCIGSHLIQKLNAENFRAIIAVDWFDGNSCSTVLSDFCIQKQIEWDDFIPWINHNQSTIEFIFHLGTYNPQLNPHPSYKSSQHYSMKLWAQCVDYQIPLIYASSSTIYGQGEEGFKEDIPLDILKPCDALGWSKWHFDRWVVQQKKKPFYWVGLRLFTVYGSNQFHIESGSCAVYHMFSQIMTTGKVTLFKSDNPCHKNRQQMRDFIYVKDVVNVCYFLMHHRKHSGFYNVGSGQAIPFLSLAKMMYQTLKKKESITFVDIPLSYRYFTKAYLAKLRGIGFTLPFYTLEEGIADYVQNYLDTPR